MIVAVIAESVERLQRHAVEWGVVIESTQETPSSIIAYGMRGETDVVLKLVKYASDEWNSGEVVQAFEHAHAATGVHPARTAAA